VHLDAKLHVSQQFTARAADSEGEMTSQATSETAGTPGWAAAVSYFAPLLLLAGSVAPENPFVDIATSFMLKNQLHAPAGFIANFRFVTAIPIYLSFVFGVVRDQWSPFGLRDRGYLLVFALAAGLVFLALALLPLSAMGLYVGLLSAMVLFRFISAALQGLMALIGQEKQMSGLLSAVSQVIVNVVSLTGGFAGGYVAQAWAPSAVFGILALIALSVAAFGVLKPAAIFRRAYEEPQALHANLWSDVRRLVRHRPIYPAILIAMMWNFAPGLATPLQFYLSNTLHTPDAVFGDFFGIYYAAYIPTILLYGWLCRRFALKTLIWWAMVLTVPQMIPLTLIHSGAEALVLAVPMGLLGGLGLAALFDLAIRSCPPGLQGTLMMLVYGVYTLSLRGSDVIGSILYELNPRVGFQMCVALTTLVYAAILPVILLIPREIIATRDGQAR